MHSKEGMTQGFTPVMIVHGIVIFPLINNLKREIPDVTQTWYADNSGSLGMLTTLETYFDSLTRQGLGCRYYPEPSTENLEAGKYFGAHHRFKFCTGAHYLGGYIEVNKSKCDWLRERMLTWEKTLTLSVKSWGNITRRVTPQLYMQSNQSGYFYNVSPGTRGTHSR